MYIQKVVTFHQKNASKRSIVLTFSVLISDGTRPQTDVKQAIELSFIHSFIHSFFHSLFAIYTKFYSARLEWWD